MATTVYHNTSVHTFREQGHSITIGYDADLAAYFFNLDLEHGGWYPTAAERDTALNAKLNGQTIICPDCGSPVETLYPNPIGPANVCYECLSANLTHVAPREHFWPMPYLKPIY